MAPPARLLKPDEFPEFQYAPHKNFLRSHSHNDDPGDGETKVTTVLVNQAMNSE